MSSTKQSNDAQMPKEEKKLFKVSGNYNQSQSNWFANPNKGNLRKVVKARKKVSKYLRNK